MRNENVSKENVTQVSGKLQKSVIEVQQKYGDILNLPHHVSETHPPMPIADRAAQFAPFAALTGHGAAIAETARLTEDRLELDESQKAVLDQKLTNIMHSAGEILVDVEYFVRDERKSGGRYEHVSGRIMKVDMYRQIILLGDESGRCIAEIPVDDVYDINEILL